MDEQSKHRDRYDTSGNPEAEFADPEKTVLRNKAGVADLERLQVLEEEALTKAYETLVHEVRVDTPMTCELLKHVHQRIFGDLYEWAGRWRTVWISKPGVTWPAPDFLEQEMARFEREVLAKWPVSKLNDDEPFCRAVGEIQGEFLVIHPFREGNARTIKVMTDLLASQTGRPLLVYDQTESGRDEYIAAAKAAFKREYAPMADIIRRALTAARQ